MLSFYISLAIRICCVPLVVLTCDRFWYFGPHVGHGHFIFYLYPESSDCKLSNYVSIMYITKLRIFEEDMFVLMLVPHKSTSKNPL